jgi:hypothetical protein
VNGRAKDERNNAQGGVGEIINDDSQNWVNMPSDIQSPQNNEIFSDYDLLDYT